jgi:hypothetical protein
MPIRHEWTLNMVQKVVVQDITNKVTEYGVYCHMDLAHENNIENSYTTVQVKIYLNTHVVVLYKFVFNNNNNNTFTVEFI